MKKLLMFLLVVCFLPLDLSYAQNEQTNAELTENVQALDVRVAAEELVRASADTALEAAIQTFGSVSAADDVALGGRIDTEATARADADTELKDADTALGDRIDLEATTRADADTALGDRIDLEVATRESRDTALARGVNAVTVRIDTEETARTDADTELKDADTALGDRIDLEATTRADADTALGDRIDLEATTRADADTALGGRITSNDARITSNQQAVSRLDRKVHDLERDLSSGIAMAMAMKSPSVPSGRSGAVSFRTGYFNQEHAVAVSGAVAIDPDWTFDMAVGLGVEREDVGVSGGFTFNF